MKEIKLKDENMSDRKAVIKNADMSEEMQQEAVDCATTALEKVRQFRQSSSSHIFHWTSFVISLIIQQF